MLDPLTAISLAGNIVQFVDFSWKVISKTRELTKSSHGATNEVYNAEILIRDLMRLTEQLKAGIGVAGEKSPAEEDKALEDLCNGCVELSKRIITRLEKLKLGEGAGKRRAFLHALKGVWSQKELESEEAQLAGYRSQLEFRIFASFRDKFNLVAISQCSDALEEASQRVILALVKHRTVFESSTLDQTNTITQLHAETRDTTVKEHEKTRSLLLDAVREVDSGRRNAVPEQNDQSKSQEQDSEIRRRAEDHILRSLRVSSISERYNRITEAHASTFEWIFKDPATEDRPWSDFARWLKSGDGLYWINGKAGSGKSTLMRFIYDHQQTRDFLRDWCGELPMTVAAFFFWNSGTPNQKSQIGLLRSLMYTVLSENRSLIPIILPDQWHDEYVDPIEWQQDFQWDQVVLERAFIVLRAQRHVRFFFLIDGLDEYEGDRDGTYQDIASFFTGLADSANIKICLSSRPWLVFEDAFHPFTGLKLQDLTSKDITRYVNDKIDGHERMRELRQVDPHNANNLTLEIVTKASGVFLWVNLAVKSLLSGFTNRDRISDLQKRLRELPADLESFYKHILLKHIPMFYHEESSQIFQIMRSANDWLWGRPSNPLRLLTLSFTEDRDSTLVLSMPNQFLTLEEIEYRSSEMAARLKSRCGGLLEHNGGYIGYLHRSVSEFLGLPETQKLLLSRTDKAFDPNESLFKACLLELKYVIGPNPGFGGPPVLEVSAKVAEALMFARRAMEMTGDSYVHFLDELDRTITYRWMSLPREIRTPQGDVLDLRRQGAHWVNFLSIAPSRYPTNACTQTDQNNFLSLAVSFGLNKYVEAKLNSDRCLLSMKRGRPLLNYIVFSECPLDAKMVSLLLQNGADPNKEFRGCSIWRYALELIEVLLARNLRIPMAQGSSAVVTNSDRQEWSRIFKLLVQGGAHPNVLCMHIKNLRDQKEIPQYVAHFLTPSKIFSPSGLFPDAVLVEMIKLRGGIEFSESVQLQSTDWYDVEIEATNVEAAVVQRFQTILRLQRSNGNPNWRHKSRRSRRKAQYRANWQRPRAS